MEEKKLGDRHKKLLNDYIQKGEINSALQAWKRLSGIANVKKVSYQVVKEYLKSLGTFVTPLLKSKVSDGNKEKRVKHAQDYLNFDFSRTLFRRKPV